MKVPPELVHRLFYPQVPVVFAASHQGRVSGMAVVSYLAAASKPPTVMVSCAERSYTLRLALKSHAFSLSVLDRSHRESVEALAAHSGSKVRDKLASAGLGHSPGRKVKAPVIKEAAATLECKVVDSINIGDHAVVVGRIVSSNAGNAFASSWDYTKYSPLLYAGWMSGLTSYDGPF
ncbi:MAG: flavin reductase family protein [archaeon]|nr:MAG: flavin reductase family protein [archaeon]